MYWNRLGTLGNERHAPRFAEGFVASLAGSLSGTAAMVMGTTAGATKFFLPPKTIRNLFIIN